MHTADVVLFLHIVVAILAFVTAALMLISHAVMKSAKDMAVVRSWERIAALGGPVFPILVLLLIALGGWLIHLSGGEFRWSDGWIMTAVITLVLMEAYGGMVLAREGKRLTTMVAGTPDGAVPAGVHAAITEPMVWAGEWGSTFAALGILFTMPVKPSGPAAIAIVAGAAVVGVLIGLAMARSGEQAGAALAAPVAERSA